MNKDDFFALFFFIERIAEKNLIGKIDRLLTKYPQFIIFVSAFCCYLSPN